MKSSNELFIISVKHTCTFTTQQDFVVVNIIIISKEDVQFLNRKYNQLENLTYAL